MTALFYAAVHEVQSLLIQRGSRPRTHDDRKAELRARWSNLAAAYDALYQRSREARYECVVHEQHHLASAEIYLTMLQQEVERERPSAL